MLPVIPTMPPTPPLLPDNQALVETILQDLTEYFSFVNTSQITENVDIFELHKFKILLADAPDPVQDHPAFETLAMRADELFSRVLLLAPPVMDPHPLDFRETRSNLFSPGTMIVENYDPKTHELTARFKSEEDYRRYNRALAQTSAQNHNFAAAKHFTDKIGMRGDVSTLKWLEQALLATAEQIRKEKGEEWKAVTYESQAVELIQTLRTRQSNYEELIAAMQACFRENTPLDIFKHFHKAVALRPECFTPHYFRLSLIRVLALDFPKEAKAYVNRAYQISPQKTFNILLIHLQLGPRTGNPACRYFRTLFKLMRKRFRDDVTIYMLAKAFKEANIETINDIDQLESAHRLAFCQHLTRGISEFRHGKLQEARNSFTAAEHFHLSDKRSYYYRALIDLEDGDIISATKLLTLLDSLVAWNDEDEIHQEQQRLLHIIGQNPTNPPPHQCLERPVLKQLIEICLHSNDPITLMDKFVPCLQAYVRELDADLLWAAAATDLAVKRLGDVSRCLEYEPFKQFLMNVYQIVPCTAFARLCYADEDVSKYEDYIFLDEENHITIAPKIILSSSGISSATLSIDPRTFRIPPAVKTAFLHDLLWERYSIFCSFFMHIAGNLDTLLEMINFDTEEPQPFYPPFIKSLLEQLDAKGSLQQRIALVQSAVANLDRWSIKQRPLLTDYLCKWLLDVIVPTKASLALSEASNQWMKAQELETKPASDLVFAYQAWGLFLDNDRTRLKVMLKSFFDRWEDTIKDGIEINALRTLCALRALMNKPEIAKTMPRRATTEQHQEVILCALSLLAHEGTAYPFVVPQIEISKQTARSLCRLYLGQRANESDTQYLKRMKNTSLKNFSDLRQTRRINDDNDVDPSETNWMIPSMRPAWVKQMIDLIEEEIAAIQTRIECTQRIAGERPSYTDDTEFIKWVEERPKLVTQFIQNPEALKREFNHAFPAFPPHARAHFFNDLEQKAKHELGYRIHKERTESSAEHQGARFWQLALQTAHVIENVQSTLRSAGEYDMALQNEEEARFVLLLIQEWSGTHWRGTAEEFIAAFHGPEIHIWGEGPRIHHFNAGVFINNRLENIHLFFKK